MNQNNELSKFFAINDQGTLVCIFGNVPINGVKSTPTGVRFYGKRRKNNT